MSNWTNIAMPDPIVWKLGVAVIIIAGIGYLALRRYWKTHADEIKRLKEGKQ